MPGPSSIWHLAELLPDLTSTVSGEFDKTVIEPNPFGHVTESVWAEEAWNDDQLTPIPDRSSQFWLGYKKGQDHVLDTILALLIRQGVYEPEQIIQAIRAQL